ncbi:MAG: pyridoxamine 5'-phosphate oxidase family protein [Methanobacteriaceae archaeon]|jgi:hypothetical protein|nr:pyridoxamine 5'-phosphate oxidase family protein [Methanobacteriaceae archaeon]
MRRSDREITDINEIVDALKKCRVCNLALFDEKYPYVVPLNFGYKLDNETNDLVLYFHGHNGGKKIDLIKKNPHAAFQIHNDEDIVVSEIPCVCDMIFESVNGNGEIEILEGEDKTEGLITIMDQYSDKKYESSDFDKKIKSTVVYKLKVNDISGKSFKK